MNVSSLGLQTKLAKRRSKYSQPVEIRTGRRKRKPSITLSGVHFPRDSKTIIEGVQKIQIVDCVFGGGKRKRRGKRCFLD